MSDLQVAKKKLVEDSLAFVIAKDGAILRTGTHAGIGELLVAVDDLGEAARGASLADKIVGKAVAMVARTAGVRAVYTPLASQAARDALAVDSVAFEYERLVPLILNQQNDGPCPMERLTLPFDDPRRAVAALRDFVKARAPAP